MITKYEKFQDNPGHSRTVAIMYRNTNPPLIRTGRYENSIFPDTIQSWKNLDEAKSKPSVQSFKKYLNNFIRPPGHPIFGIHDILGIILLTKIRVSFSDFLDHRFNHNFNCNNPICLCGFEVKTSIHFFQCCPRTTLLSKISDIISSDVTVFPNEHLYFSLQ